MQTRRFPMSNQAGSDTSHINPQAIRQFANIQQLLTPADVRDSIEQHANFLRAGGAGGTWKPLCFRGVVVAVYEHPLDDPATENALALQANFEHRRFAAGGGFEGVELPFANFCGAYCPNISFRNSLLSHSFMADGVFEYCNFEGAVLCQVDFSRANLRYANFQNAHLEGADFENCLLEYANFRGANTTEARFPGAVLTGVYY